ncbi:MAG TPA: Gfo/Idh/MocA family oxidoreductase [Acidobacteriaceae bacterium]|jgi:predicted dehydrogenase
MGRFPGAGVNTGSKVRIALIGCGAISELYYAPVLAILAQQGKVEVTHVVDPQEERAKTLAKLLGEVRCLSSLDQVDEQTVDMAIVASPPGFHSVQTKWMLERDTAVLCEKPMAMSYAEAEEMVTLGEARKTLLAVGLFRRFFPSNEAIRQMISDAPLGKALHVEIAEGGRFNWPARSTSFFDRRQSGGGVLADLGVHSLDLLCWWFGMPVRMDYEDDAMGGLEANCKVRMEFEGGCTASLRLTRDLEIPNHISIQFERGRVRHQPAAADKLEIRFQGERPFTLNGGLTRSGKSGDQGNDYPVLTYHQSFTRQLTNMIAALRGQEELVVSGASALSSARIIEDCYASKRLMTMPWLTEVEVQRARQLGN